MKNEFLGVLAVFILLSVWSCTSGRQQQRENTRSDLSLPNEILLFGGPIYSMQSEKHRVEAVYIRGAHIFKAGRLADIENDIGPQTKRIDLKGRTVIPGLTDAHMHLFGLGRNTLYVDLVGTRSIKEIKSRLKDRIKNTTAGQWIRGRGWDQNDWATKDSPFPSAKDLDDISPDHPIALTRIDGHALWVNSKALQVAKIDHKTNAPEGGKIIRRQGQSSGIFVDNAMPLIRKQIPGLSRTQLKAAALRAQALCLKSGLTQVHDMGIGREGLSILKEIQSEGQLKLRVYAMIDGDSKDLKDLFQAGPRVPKSESDLLTIRGVKFYIDGALGSRGAALFEPYDDDPKNRGLFLTPISELEKRIRLAKKFGFQVSIHAIGDRGSRTVLDLYEKIFGINTAHRPRLEHAQVLSLKDIPRLAKLGVIASMQPSHATSDMPWAEKRVGPERIQGAYAWRRLLTNNATIAAGSDAPVENIAPKFGLYAAMTRQDISGNPKGGWYPDQIMNAHEAVAAFTKNAAYAAFRESEIGVIKAGNLADLSVLNIDPFNDEAMKLLGDIIEMTIVNGKIVYEK
jgi:predicted amidohydrolase YtcJ